jgi:hypothetical protein
VLRKLVARTRMLPCGFCKPLKTATVVVQQAISSQRRHGEQPEVSVEKNLELTANFDVYCGFVGCSGAPERS